MKVYISGKISGLSVDQYHYNFIESCYCVYRLYPIITNHLYNPCINPLGLKPFLGIKIWICYMITDLYHLRKCTHIAMQKNWIDSKGSVIEYWFAKFIFKQKIIWL